MFEQTLLTHPASARKTGAVAASLLAQTAIVGVLLIGPLLYTQVLPIVQLSPPLWLPARPVTPPPVTEVVLTSEPSSTPSLRPFVGPTQVPQRRLRDIVIEDGPMEAPEPALAYIGPAVPIAGTPSLQTLTAPPQEVAVVKPLPAPTPTAVKPVLVGGDVLAAKLLKRVVPTYPALARQIRISGSVHLLGTVAKDGRVLNLRVLDGHPLLRQAALDAVSQWIYSPTILNGQPVEVEAPIEVNFALR
jgi:protein TonB